MADDADKNNNLAISKAALDSYMQTKVPPPPPLPISPDISAEQFTGKTPETPYLFHQLHDARSQLNCCLNSAEDCQFFGIDTNFSDLPPERQKALFRAVCLLFEGLESSDVTLLPTKEQAKLTFSCAYHIHDEMNPLGKYVRHCIQKAAEVLDIGELYGPECLQAQATYDCFQQFASLEAADAFETKRDASFRSRAARKNCRLQRLITPQGEFYDTRS